MKRITTLLGLSILLLSNSAFATAIYYDVTNLGGSSWQYDYTVENDTLGVDIEEFTIYFDASLYENLAVAGSPTGWDSLVIQPDSSLPDDGFFDSCSSAPYCFGDGVGIAAGASLGGFSVMFDFLGAGGPGDQSFDIVDPFDFEILDSGITTRNAVQVPEPSTIALFTLGLMALGLVRRRRDSALVDSR